MTNSTNPLTVTPIGSCRITQPLKSGQVRLGYTLNRGGVYGYCHSSSEAVQMVKVLLEQHEIPDEIWPLLTKSEAPIEKHIPSQKYVVELSSAKSITIDGWSIQLNYLTSRFPEVFADQNRARAFWTLVDTDDQDLLIDFLKKTEVRDVDLLGRIKRRFTDQDDLRRDMKQLLKLLPDVTFVTHVNARQKTGEHIQSRSDFIQDVETCARNLGASCYNPTTVMRFVGQANAMADDSDGLAHYREDFEEVVTNDLGRILLPNSPGTELPISDTKNPITNLMNIAARRSLDPEETGNRLRVLSKTNPELALPAIAEHLAQHSSQIKKFPKTLRSLCSQDQDILWARSGLGQLVVNVERTDREVAGLIDWLAKSKSWERLDSFLTSLDCATSNLLSTALDRFLSASFETRSDALEATKVVLKHAPKHQMARGLLYHFRTWLAAQDVDAASNDLLNEMADLNVRLPASIQAVDLALARRAFKDGDDKTALAVGQRVHKSAPENLTLLVMLMRSAKRCGDASQQDFASRVLEQAAAGSNFQMEARDILSLGRVSA